MNCLHYHSCAWLPICPSDFRCAPMTLGSLGGILAAGTPCGDTRGRTVQCLSLSMTCGCALAFPFYCFVYHRHQKTGVNTYYLIFVSQTLNFTEENFTENSQLEFYLLAYSMSAVAVGYSPEIQYCLWPSFSQCAEFQGECVLLASLLALQNSKVSVFCWPRSLLCFSLSVCFSFSFLTCSHSCHLNESHVSLYLFQNELW